MSESILALVAGLVAGGALGYFIAKLRSKAEAGTEEVRLRAMFDSAKEQNATMSKRLDAANAAITAAEKSAAEIRGKLAERDTSIAALKQMIEMASLTLKNEFKATGAEVLAATKDRLMRESSVQQAQSSKDLMERQQAIKELLRPLEAQLVEQKKLVSELTGARAQDVGKLDQELVNLTRLQEKAAKAAGDLENALRDNKRRGRWGEIALKNIVEAAGMVEHVDFIEQVAIDGSNGSHRPDMQVSLPGGRIIPIDAKVPISAYLEYTSLNATPAVVVDKRAQHARDIKMHVKELISRDYPKMLNSGVEFTVMFIPIESAMTLALEEDPDLYDFAISNKVIITSPSTLMVLLRTCGIYWQHAKLAENAQLIGAEVQELLDRIRKFSEHLTKMGKGLEAANRSWDSAVGSFNSRLVPITKKLADLSGDASKAVEELEDVTSDPSRSVTAFSDLTD